MEPVKPKLDLVIAHLEAERKALKRMIREANAEHDSLIVYYHSEALLDLNRRINVLYNFRDPYFNQKEELIRQINFWRKNEFTKQFKPQIREFVKKRNEEKAKELEKDLQKLINKPPAPIAAGGKKFEKALFDLYDEQYTSFEILLGEDDYNKFSLIFRIKRKLLTIELKGDFYNDDPDFVFDNRVPQPIKAAGFKYDERRKRYICTFDIAGFNNVNEIKIWFAKFIIEDSWHYWPGGTMQLEYKTPKK
jgi:hypothetical protein